MSSKKPFVKILQPKTLLKVLLEAMKYFAKAALAKYVWTFFPKRALIRPGLKMNVV
jgi:hypothetical protein